LGAYLFSAAQDVAVDAQVSITDGAVSGAGHVPSVAPNPPNNDTGVLANNIEATQGDSQGNANQVAATVSSNAPYGAVHELGGSKLPARPYLVPALAKNRDNIARKVAAGVNKANRTDG
jgi:hypothetical protein